MILFRLSDLPRWLRDIVPLIVWMGLIFWFSSRSILVDIDNKTNEIFVYKGSHLLAYALLAWLWWRALAPQRRFSWPILATALTFSTLYGISDEIHQSYVPGRHGRVADMLFDAGGALAMTLLIRRIKWLRIFPEGFSRST